MKTRFLSLVLAGAGAMLAAPAGATEPTAAQLAESLGTYAQRTVAPDDLRDIACERDAEEPTEFNCRWQQRTDRGWSGYSTWLALEADRWTMLDDPLPEPETHNRRLERERKASQ